MSKWLYAMLCAVLVLGGCGKSEEERAEEKTEEAMEAEMGEGADVDIDEGKMTIENADGKFQMSQGGDLKVPDDFPDDVLVLEDHKISWSTSNAEMQHLTYTTKMDQAKVVEEYKKAMTEKEWKAENTMQTPEGTIMTFTKGENRSANVSIGKDGEATQVTLMINTEPAAAQE